MQKTVKVIAKIFSKVGANAAGVNDKWFCLGFYWYLF